jgi:hypothetical protein
VDAAAEVASDAAAVAVADTVDAAAEVVSARAAETFLHPSTLRLKAKIVAVIAVLIVDQIAEAIAVVAAIRIAAATKIVALGVISKIAVPTLRVLPLRQIPRKNRLCSRANRLPNTASVRCR